VGKVRLLYKMVFFLLSGSPNKRFIGTIRINSSGSQCDDTFTKRFVWNNDNQLPRRFKVAESTSNWRYEGGYRNLNNSSNNRIEYVCGNFNADLQFKLMGMIGVVNQMAAKYGIGLDSSSVDSSYQTGSVYSEITSFWRGTVYCVYDGSNLGYHYLQLLE